MSRRISGWRFSTFTTTALLPTRLLRRGRCRVRRGRAAERCGRADRSAGRLGQPAQMVARRAQHQVLGSRRASLSIARLDLGPGRWTAHGRSIYLPTMKVVCAWCLQEGKPGDLGEREPLEDGGLTHSICGGHRDQLLEDLPSRSFQMSRRSSSFAQTTLHCLRACRAC